MSISDWIGSKCKGCGEMWLLSSDFERVSFFTEPRLDPETRTATTALSFEIRCTLCGLTAIYIHAI